MRPPEATLFGTGDILRRVGHGMMQAMISDPARGMTGAVENGPEDQELFDESVGLERLVGEQAVIANRGAAAAKGHEENHKGNELEAGAKEKNETNDSKDVG